MSSQLDESWDEETGEALDDSLVATASAEGVLPGEPLFSDDADPGGQEESPERPLAFANAEEWVKEFALPHFRRPLNKSGFKWDPEWWKYEESGTVLEALWETWEQMRWSGATGIAAFFRDYFYPLMGQLTAPEGPFWQYDPPENDAVPAMWPSQDAPPGWFRDAHTEA